MFFVITVMFFYNFLKDFKVLMNQLKRCMTITLKLTLCLSKVGDAIRGELTYQEELNVFPMLIFG